MMMVRKTIRGTVNTTHLDEGEEADIEVTDHVQGLVDNGYVEFVDKTDTKAPKKTGESGHTGEGSSAPGRG